MTTGSVIMFLQKHIYTSLATMFYCLLDIFGNSIHWNIDHFHTPLGLSGQGVLNVTGMVFALNYCTM